MNDFSIYDFKVRVSYPNFNTIRYFLQNDTSKDFINKDNYLPPEVEYLEERTSKPKLIIAHFFDLPFLSRDNTEKAKEYLAHLIKSEQGNKESEQYIEQLRLRNKNEFIKQYGNVSFVENEYVVPSSTTNKYTEEYISHKGSILLDLIQRLFPVPDFCVLTSNAFFSDDKEKSIHLQNAINNLEKMTGARLGDKTNPLVFAMRSATSFYIPGFLPTYLNVGINDAVYDALKNKYGLAVAGKIYVNNLQTIYKALFPEKAGDELCRPVSPYFPINEIENKVYELKEAIQAHEKDILTDPFRQVMFFTEKTNEFFLKNQDLAYTLRKGEVSYPSIIMQKMVWTICNDECYPGVLYSRHSRTGMGIQIESVRNMFGDDIMTGNVDRTDTEFFDREEIRETFPAVYHFVPCLSKQESLLESPVTIEFAAESYNDVYHFAVLQLNTAELTGRSILLSSVDMYKKGVITGERVLKLVQPYHLKQIFSERIDDKSFRELTFFCRGISVLPRSAVTARIFFSATSAMEAKRKGEKVCLCKETYIPSDTIILSELDAIISFTPMAVHVVTSCLGYGIPAFISLNKYGVEIKNNTLINKDGVVVKEGDWITLSSKHKMILLGQARYAVARFRSYLEGKNIELLPKEEPVFKKMKAAYDVYKSIIIKLDSAEITSLTDLIKIIRNDLRDDTKKASALVCKWFDTNKELYCEQILKSELGTHHDQNLIYSLLTTGRKIDFFKTIIEICIARNISGYTAGSFMLGRFICLQHPVDFWKKMNEDEIIFLLNEYILFEKYIQVLNDLGERNINKARKKILKDGISSINLSYIDPKVFITLKLVFKDWDLLQKKANNDFDPETFALINFLMQPFGNLYDYKSPWALNELKKVCEKEQMPFPKEDAV
ncbi:MAG: hypothetical protein M0R16_01830 [Bacteroidales bacterium]|jgi:hypothetical protein|nr:hypothetical protein [Bacteroidales bacterium]